MAASVSCLAFVGGLSRGTTAAEVLQLFAAQGFGSILDFSLVPSRGFGFLHLASAEDRAALLHVRGLTLHDRPVYVLAPDSATAPTVMEINGPVAAKRGATLFVRGISQALDLQAARAALSMAATRHSGSSPAVHVVAKQSGGGHRGYGFVACPSAADAALVMAGLQAQAKGWHIEWARPKGKGGGRRKEGKGRRKGRHGQRRGARGGGGAAGQMAADEAESEEEEEADEYLDDFEELANAAGGADALAPTDAARQCGDGTAGAGLPTPRSEPPEVQEQLSDALLPLVLDPPCAASDVWSRDDPLHTHDEDAVAVAGAPPSALAAMGEFVASSAEWSMFINGFLLQHCHAFDESEENRLEWHTLHVEFCSKLDVILETQLSKLGVAVDDFVDLLQEEPQTHRNDFLEAVLAMDDFGRFKAAMLELKRDLCGYALPADTLDAVKGSWSGRHAGLADF